MKHAIPTYQATLDTESIIRLYRNDIQTITKACHNCANYGKYWTCPPFSFDITKYISKWKMVNIYLYAIDVPENIQYSSDGESMNWLRNERVDIERDLLEKEMELSGMYCSVGGTCIHCERCTRNNNNCNNSSRCIHPELMRPPLEAFGFNVCDIMHDLFDVSPQWAVKPATMPEKLHLLGAVFHNGTK